MTTLAEQSLERIGRSQDDVSKKLRAIFVSAIAPDEPQLNRARLRKEIGNPPGKRGDPLGDQLTWEQLLSVSAEKPVRLWLISRDRDYCDRLGKGAVLLNPFLHQEVLEAFGEDVQVRCFDDLGNGIRDFVELSGVTAARRVSEAEAKAIKEETDALPPIDWRATDFANTNAILGHTLRQKNFIAAISNTTALGPLPVNALSIAAGLAPEPAPTPPKAEDG